MSDLVDVVFKYTCSELNMVKSQANAVVLAFTVNTPSTQVMPRIGRRTSVAINSFL